MSMPDKDKVEECDKCTRLAIHTFTKRDHEAFSLDWVCYLKLEMNPWDGPKFFLSVTFEKAWEIIHVGCHLVRQLDKLWNGETPKLWDSISNVEARVWATHLFGRRLILCFLEYLNFDPPIPKLLKLFVITDPFKFFPTCISWISSNPIWGGWISCWQWFHGICFTPGCMTVSTFYEKTSKMNYAFTSLNGFLFNCPSLIFYNALRFWGIIF